MFQSLAQHFLLSQEPEWSHDLTINFLKKTQRSPLAKLYTQTVDDSPVELFGLTFKNPLGLAAGLDKNGECIDAFAAMGFGFIEVGTVTPEPQDGNPKPRLFRIPEKQAIINRMGFNNKGVDYLVEQVKQANYAGVLGINIGKNKWTAEQDALNDYLICLKKVYAHASYVTINISSPNTPGLRNLQYGETLKQLISGLQQEQSRLYEEHQRYVPMLIKIAPDQTDEELNSIADTFIECQVDGVIATNTTLDRDTVEGLQHASEMGGLSGSVLTAKSQTITEKLVKLLPASIPVVGVGGIDSAATAAERLDSGAKLIQLYSSFIYQGPPLIKNIVRAL
jgi:dihydroorotate dehydrogenase